MIERPGKHRGEIVRLLEEKMAVHRRPKASTQWAKDLLARG